VALSRLRLHEHVAGLLALLQGLRGGAMKCPRCRKEIAFAAMEHVACGWKLPSMTVVRPIVRSEVGEKALALMRSMIKIKVRKMEERKPAGPLPGVEVTPGHGTICTCEFCFPKRMRRQQVSERLKALAERLDAIIERDGMEVAQ
jgi:hypothetical protein